MKTLIILHGWQSSKEKWADIKEKLESSGIQVIVPDIPGFKPETILNKTWNLDDYLSWFEDFLLKRKIVYSHDIQLNSVDANTEGFFLLGHSFGARISIKFAEKYPGKIKGLILVSAAGIKKQDTLYGKLLGFMAKTMKVLKIEEASLSKGFIQFLKKVFYRYILRKTDYFKASGFLKETIKRILAEDLTHLLDKISVPTLILWGKRDKITPLKDAELMHKKIKNSKLEIFNNAGHPVHLECPKILTQKVKTFLE